MADTRTIIEQAYSAFNRIHPGKGTVDLATATRIGYSAWLAA